jgi:hypothetical protein
MRLKLPRHPEEYTFNSRKAAKLIRIYREQLEFANCYRPIFKQQEAYGETKCGAIVLAQHYPHKNIYRNLTPFYQEALMQPTQRELH